MTPHAGRRASSEEVSVIARALLKYRLLLPGVGDRARRTASARSSAPRWRALFEDVDVVAWPTVPATAAAARQPDRRAALR